MCCHYNSKPNAYSLSSLPLDVINVTLNHPQPFKNLALCRIMPYAQPFNHYCLIDWPSCHHLCIICTTSINGFNIININHQLQLSCRPSSNSNHLSLAIMLHPLHLPHPSIASTCINQPTLTNPHQH